MLRVGIIGMGKMGQLRAAVINKIPDLKIIEVYDPSSISDLRNFKKASTAEEVIDNPEIDLVFICTPNYLNQSLTIKALNSGRHVFCEKPPTLTASEMEAVISVERSAGKVLMYGFNHRQHGSIHKMRELIDQEDYGQILWMRGRYGKSVDEGFLDNWRATRKYAGGGILIDQGIHMLDLLLAFAGDFDKVHATVSNLYWKLDVEDNVFATLENSKTGLVASLHSTMSHWRHLFSLEIFLERGYLVLNGLKTPSNTYGEETLTAARISGPAATRDNEEDFSFETDQSWEIEVTEFVSAIRKNRPPRFGGSQDALKLMHLVDKIYSFRER